MRKIKKPVRAVKAKAEVVKSAKKFDPKKAISAVIEVIEYDWNKIPAGTWFTAFIEKSKVVGRIQKESGSIYLCNSGRSGSEPLTHKFGFKYSWSIGSGKFVDLKNNSITDLVLLAEKPKGFEVPPIPIRIAGYDTTFSKGHINVGCKVVTNKEVREIVKRLID